MIDQPQINQTQQADQANYKPWSTVEANPEYQKLNVSQQDEAKSQYFDQVVSNRPDFKQLTDDDKSNARQEFLSKDDEAAKSAYEDGQSSKFEKQMTAGMYQHAPFGKDLVLAYDPNTAKNIARTPQPKTWDEKLGRFTGAALGILPSFGLGEGIGSLLAKPAMEGAGVIANMANQTGDAATIAKAGMLAKNVNAAANTAKLAGGSFAAGAQTGVEAKTAGATTGEAIKEGAENSGLMFVGGKVLEGVGNAIANSPAFLNYSASRINNSVIKPHGKDFLFGKDPGGFLARNVKSPDNTLDGWKVATDDVIDSKMAEAKSIVEEKQGATVNVKDAINGIYSKAMDDAAKVGDDNLFSQLSKDKQTLENNQVVVKDPATGEVKIGSSGQRDLENLPLADAIDLKRTIGKMTTDWTKGPEYLKTLSLVRRQAYGAVRQATEDVAPELGKVNSDIADGISASNAIGRRMAVEQRQNMLGLYSVAGGAAVIHGLFTGNIGTLASGIATIGADAIMKSPYIASRVAMALSKVGSGMEREQLFQAVPWLKEQYGNIMSSFKNINPQVAFGNAGKVGEQEGKSIAGNMFGMENAGEAFAQPGVAKEPVETTRAIGGPEANMESEGAPAIQYSGPNPQGERTNMMNLRRQYEAQRQAPKEDLNYQSKAGNANVKALAGTASLIAVGEGASKAMGIRNSNSLIIPKNEEDVINRIAKGYGLNKEQTNFLKVIRKVENGGAGKEFGVLTSQARRFKNDPEKSFELQARWAAGSIKKHFNGDIDAFAKRWAPHGVANDPHNLNANWTKNAKFYMKKLSSGG